jgi:hypothetical protein
LLVLILYFYKGDRSFISASIYDITCGWFSTSNFTSRWFSTTLVSTILIMISSMISSSRLHLVFLSGGQGGSTVRALFQNNWHNSETSPFDGNSFLSVSPNCHQPLLTKNIWKKHGLCQSFLWERLFPEKVIVTVMDIGKERQRGRLRSLDLRFQRTAINFRVGTVLLYQYDQDCYEKENV